MFRLGYRKKLAGGSAGKGRDTLAAGGIDEIATQVKVGIQELETACFVHGAHAFVRPLFTDAHRTELKGGDMHASTRGENSVLSEFRRWWWCVRHRVGVSFLSNPLSVGSFIYRFQLSITTSLLTRKSEKLLPRRNASSQGYDTYHAANKEWGKLPVEVPDK